mmetsp:Transcript_20092/g.68064  ORF Transcript_20092/g.68064 Transcript_20092/m.68064 type:complete len:289 (-) Transcript_20092:798-1664(-)
MMASVLPAAQTSLFGWKASAETGPMRWPRKPSWYRTTLSCSPDLVRNLINWLCEPDMSKGADSWATSAVMVDVWTSTSRYDSSGLRTSQNRKSPATQPLATSCGARSEVWTIQPLCSRPKRRAALPPRARVSNKRKEPSPNPANTVQRFDEAMEVTQASVVVWTVADRASEARSQTRTWGECPAANSVAEALCHAVTRPEDREPFDKSSAATNAETSVGVRGTHGAWPTRPWNSLSQSRSNPPQTETTPSSDPHKSSEVVEALSHSSVVTRSSVFRLASHRKSHRPCS